MTLREYLDQPDPRKQALGSVILEPTDYQVLCFYGKFPVLCEIIIYEGDSTTYVVDMDNRMVYTTDPDGNKKHLTVFRLSDL